MSIFCLHFGIVSTEISNLKCANGSALTISGNLVTDKVYEEQLLIDIKPQVANASLVILSKGLMVEKKGLKDIRLCVNFQKLNKFCLKPTNPQKTPLETLRSLPKGEVWFFCADMLKGYHQIRLDEESEKKTAFYMLFGIYMYTYLPMG